MKPLAQMTRGELAAYIQSHLRARGIDSVLTGGSAVSIFSGENYVSIDLDFVITSYPKRSKIADAMHGIGFHQAGRHFKHPETSLLVEFPGGPLSVGKQQVSKIDTIEYETGKLRIISPADCVKDRLAAYYHWGDRQSLSQAIMVIQENPIDLSEIAAWSQAEGVLTEFKIIEPLLRDASVQSPQD
jgi:hypothetical protein